MKSIFRWDRGIFKKIEEGPIVYFVFLSRYIASDLILEFSFIVEFSKIRVTENYFFQSVMPTRVEAALRLLPV